MLDHILVTGGAGFIGYHTIKSLIAKGNHVICIDNLDSSHSSKIQRKMLGELKRQRKFIFYKEDIRKKYNLELIFYKERPEAIIHLASKVGVRASIDNPKVYFDVNVNGTLNFLELARKYAIKKFIFASSSSVYGNNKKIPFNEDGSTSSQISPYGASKKSAEILCRTYNNLYKIPTICLRFFTVYGPYGRPDMSPFLFTDAVYKGRLLPKFGDGTSKRDYTYVDDITNGILSSLALKCDFEIINIGGGTFINLNKFISLIESLLNKKVKIKKFPRQKGDIKMTLADISKAKRLLDYRPKHSIAEGMKKFTDWYLRNQKFL